MSFSVLGKFKVPYILRKLFIEVVPKVQQRIIQRSAAKLWPLSAPVMEDYWHTVGKLVLCMNARGVCYQRAESREAPRAGGRRDSKILANCCKQVVKAMVCRAARGAKILPNS